MTDPYMMGNYFTNHIPIKGLEGFISLAVLLLGIGLCAWSSHRVKRTQRADV